MKEKGGTQAVATDADASLNHFLESVRNLCSMGFSRMVFGNLIWSTDWPVLDSSVLFYFPKKESATCFDCQFYNFNVAKEYRILYV